MINQRYMAVSPRGFNSESISPRGFNSLSVSPRGFNSFLILFMMAFCFSVFSQTEGKYDVIINKNSKITFTGFQLNKTQPYYGFKQYEVLAPIVNVAGANNGLTLNGQTVQLGGTLIKNTNIAQAGFNLTTSGVGNFGIGTTTPTKKLDIIDSPVQNTYATIQGVNLFGDATTQAGFLGYRIGLNNTTGNASASFDIARTPGTAYLGAEINSASRDGVRILTGATEATLTEKVRINNAGNVGIGTSAPTHKIEVINPSGGNSSTAYFKNGNGSGGYAVRGESINVGAALGVYGELGVWDGTRWSGVRGNSGTSNAPAITGINTVVGGVSAYFNERVGVGTTTPTSTLHTNGSVSETVTVITATTTLNETHNKILLQNGANAITINLPNALTCLGRKYEFSRYAGSTGGVTILPGGGQIQALNGTVGASTSIGLHSVTGGGLRHSLTAVNIGGVGVWVRI